MQKLYEIFKILKIQKRISRKYGILMSVKNFYRLDEENREKLWKKSLVCRFKICESKIRANMCFQQLVDRWLEILKVSHYSKHICTLMSEWLVVLTECRLLPAMLDSSPATDFDIRSSFLKLWCGLKFIYSEKAT